MITYNDFILQNLDSHVIKDIQLVSLIFAKNGGIFRGERSIIYMRESFTINLN